MQYRNGYEMGQHEPPVHRWGALIGEPAMTFDFIIGGGSAGSIPVHRLSARQR